MNLLLFKYVRVPYEHLGLKFREGQFIGLIKPGSAWVFDPLDRITIKILSQTVPKIDLQESKLKQLKDHPEAATLAEFVELNDATRGLVWFDGRFRGILTPGLYGFWTSRVDVRIETFPIDTVRFTHPDLDVILRAPEAPLSFIIQDVPEGQAGVLFIDGRFSGDLASGRYAFWRDAGNVKVYTYDLREQVLDVTGQDIMTQDKVTLRLNAVLTYRIKDPRLLAETTVNAEQALYREVQHVLRSEVGTRSLDQLLCDKASVAQEALGKTIAKASTYGIQIKDLGIRDIILPGDMKELLNQVIEAEKAAQANGIKRREETAAMRSQLNTAKLIEQNPTLLRLRDLESVEKITESANLQIIVGDGQELSQRLVKLI